MPNTTNNSPNINSDHINNIETFTVGYPQSRATSNEYSSNIYFTESIRSFENSNSSIIGNVQSRTVLPPISSLINTGSRRERHSFASTNQGTNELVIPDMEMKGVPTRSSVSPIQTKAMMRVKSFPSINTINSQYNSNNLIQKNDNNTPTFLCQPQSQLKLSSQRPPQQSVSYVQYVTPSISKTITPSSIPSSNYISHTIQVPTQPQQPLLSTLQYAVPVQQPQLAMLNNNGVLTAMTPVNFISPMGPQPQAFSQISSQRPQQFIIPSQPQQQGTTMNMSVKPSQVINYVLTPMMTNNNNTPVSPFTNNRSNTTTIKPSPQSSVSASPPYMSDSSRSLSLPLKVNTPSSSVKENIKKSFGTTNTIDCNTTASKKISHSRSSSGVTKKSSKYISKKSKDNNDIHLPAHFINHGNKTVKIDEKNKNYTVAFSSAVKHRKQCSICGKVCSRPSTLKTHYLIHTGDTPFKCTFEGCYKAFNVKSNMLRHMKCHQRFR
ncbi:hypothetical protein MOUN0_E05424 [Monosporozyma unispora]|nr:hypothetical protein C6P44_000308 [Kazachstania unispora]